MSTDNGATATVQAGVTWMDQPQSGTQLGTQSNPYKTIHAGVQNVQQGGIITIAGGHLTSGGDGIINISKPVRIVSNNGTASIGPN